MRRILSTIICLTLTSAAFLQPFPASAENSNSDQSGNLIETVKLQSYGDYALVYQDKMNLTDKIVLDKSNLITMKDTEIKPINGEDAFLTGENSELTYRFSVPKEGKYNMLFSYYPIEGRGSQIERQIEVDGKVPFEESKSIVFSRIYKDTLPYNNGFQFDSKGNEIRPQQIQAPDWTDHYLSDTTGYYKDPFSFYFSAGEHTVKIKAVNEALAIKEIRLEQKQGLKSYKEIEKDYKTKGYGEVENQKIVYTQAENAFNKSDATLFPNFDRSNPATEPFSPNKILLNTIGGSRWRYPGQWISWKITAPESGLYRIGLRARQNFVSGQFVTRKLFINGEVPFSEAENIRFDFDNNWKNIVFSSENGEYLFYLNKGENTLTLEATLGDFSEIISSVQSSIYNLNYVYRQILMITGLNPDVFRDYDLGQRLPDCIKILGEESKSLKEILIKIKALSNTSGTYTSAINKMIVRIDEMLKNTDNIPSMFVDYQNNIVGLGAWLLSAKEQPLELDYIMVLPKTEKTPPANVNLFKNISSGIEMFIASFFNDYSNIGDHQSTNETISVWVATGRDQAGIIKQLADNYFTPSSKINVNIKLVGAGSLLPAVLAGKGPDVNLSAASNEPMNYAMRKAVRKLNDLPDFKETIAQFYPSALTPYTYDGTVYALPETQSFPLLFYRSDILSELGIKKIDTWDDIYNIIPELQKKNLNFGLPAFSSVVANALDLTAYWTLLFQHNGQVFSEDSSKIIIDSKVGISAFKQWTEFYTNYSIPSSYDFATRFRSGDIPIAIADYTNYNLLSVFAPEINGLWSFAPIPGTKNTDGSINRSVFSAGAATEMMATTTKVSQSWDFMKWWSSSETQVNYGRELESILGTSARYPAANKNAISQMPWTTAQVSVINEQWQHTKGVPEVPGGYLKDREINFAMRAVLFNGAEPREALTDHIYNINLEIDKMRKEFGLK